MKTIIKKDTCTTVFIAILFTITMTWKEPQFSSVQLLSHIRLFVTPWTAAHQASLSITDSRSLPKLVSIESVMPSNHLILCRPLLLLPPVLPNIRVFSNESALHIRRQPTCPSSGEWMKKTQCVYNTERLFMRLLAICMSSLEKHLLRSLPIF